MASYETHHKQFHILVCMDCQLHFPTEQILALHLEERHDPFVEAQRARRSYKVDFHGPYYPSILLFALYRNLLISV